MSEEELSPVLRQRNQSESELLQRKALLLAGWRYPLAHPVDEVLQSTLTSSHEQAQALSVEIRLRAGWKIFDDGLLSGSAGSARGKDVNFNSKRKKKRIKKKQRKSDTIEDTLLGPFFRAVGFIFQGSLFIVC